MDFLMSVLHSRRSLVGARLVMGAWSWSLGWARMQSTKALRHLDITASIIFQRVIALIPNFAFLILKRPDTYSRFWPNSNSDLFS